MQNIHSIFAIVAVLTAPANLIFGDDWNKGFPAGRGAQVLHAQISPDGRVLAMACSDRSIRLWDMKEGRELRRLIGHADKPSVMSFSHDGKRIVSSTRYGVDKVPFRIWSVATGELIAEGGRNGDVSGAVAYAADGTIFAEIQAKNQYGGLSASQLVSYDGEGQRLLRTWGKMLTFSKNFDMAKDGRHFLYDGGNRLQSQQLLDVQTGRSRTLPVHVKTCVLSPDGRYIAGLVYDSTSANAQTFAILDANTLTEIRRVTGRDHITSRYPVNFRQVEFAADSRSVIGFTDSHWLRCDINTGNVIRVVALEQRRSGFQLTPDGQQIMEYGIANHVTVRNLETTMPVARFHCLDSGGQWACQTAAGYYHHSAGVTPKLSSRHPTAADADRIRSSPTMVARLLRGMSVVDAEALPENGVPPTVQLQLVANGPDSATLQVTAEAATPEASIQEVSVRVNGRELNSISTKSLVVVAAPSAENARRKFEVVAPFPPGQNSATVQAIAIDSYGQRSKVATVDIERSIKVRPVTGRLFVLAVGVSQYSDEKFNLRYCHADAEALAALLMKQKGRAFGDVQVQVYTDKKATVTNVKDGLDWLKRSCTPADVAVVLFSGHGIRRERGLYYVTHEANLEGVQYTCLNWETVAASLKETQAKQVLFLSDACHAGAFGTTTLASQKDISDSLRDKAGVMVFASSRANELSREDPQWQHGAFVKAILEGLAGSADLNRDGKVTVQELQTKTTQRVVELTDGKQHPELPDIGGFDPNLVLATTPAK